MAQMISLWTFACKLYSQPAVKNTCLHLQDDYAVNVPLLLTSCWVAQHYSALSDKHVSLLQHLAAQWQVQCIQPLRALRQQMKLNLPAENSDSWTLVREQIKSTELLAEQQLLQALEASIQQYIPILGEIDVKPFPTEVIMNEQTSINHLLATIYRFIPILVDMPQVNAAVANIVAGVVSERLQIQYDAILNRVNQY